MTEATTTLSQPIIRTRQLTLEEFKSLNLPIVIQDETVLIDYSFRG